MTRSFSRTAVVAGTVFFAMALAFGGGCSSSGTERSQAAITSLSDLRLQAMTMRDQIDMAMAALNEMQSTTDLNNPFENFSAQLEAIGHGAETLKYQAADLESHIQEYVAKWESDMSNVKDPSLKASAEERQAAVKQRYKEIQAAQKAVAENYKIFYGDLTSLHTYLANDLTPAGVKGASASIKKANDDRATLRKSGDTFIELLDEITAGMTGSAPPPPQGPTLLRNP